MFQTEDNIVNQIKNTKEKRQIIIVTHSAIIVTNSISDLVCVMDQITRMDG